MYLTQDDVQAEIEKKKDALGEEIKEIDDKVDVLKTEMSDLKTKLYAKFGNAINLEADEE